MRTIGVAALTAELAVMFEERLAPLWLEGELRQLQEPSSGHAYFTLGEGDAICSGVVWRSDWAKLSPRPKVGDRVVARGRLKVWAPLGRWQIYASELRPAGAGAAAARLAAARARLEAEGLTDPRRRRPLPQRPGWVGLVTSRSGAALHDFVRVSGERFPAARVLLSPSTVQGADAPVSVMRAVELLCEDGRAEVIVVARGGGSRTDLEAFDHEELARFLATVPGIPVVTAIGHETDRSLCDLVADAVAPTPTAAAVLVLPDRAALAGRVESVSLAAERAVRHHLQVRRERLAAVIRRHRHPGERVATARRHHGTMADRLARIGATLTAARRARLGALTSQLEALSPTATLARGYAVVRTVEGAIVRGPHEVAGGDALHVDLAKGRIEVVVRGG